jgi:hypothetical protein
MRSLTLVLLLSLAIPAHAGPKDWLKRQFTDHPVRTSIVLGGVGSAVEFLGVYQCRKKNIEPEGCLSGYGNPWPEVGIVAAWNTGIAPFVARGCWRDNPGAKFCNIFAYAGTGYAAGQGIYDWRNKHAETDSWDRSGLTFRRH